MKARVDGGDENGVLGARDASSADGSAKSAMRSAGTTLAVRFAEAQKSLGIRRERLLSQILNEADETFFMSTREMAQRYRVDPSTIVRATQAMGYERFADFAQDLRSHFVTQIAPSETMKVAARTKSSVANYVRQSIEHDLENLTALKNSLDPDMVVSLAKQILAARRIVVVGIDFAASLAVSLAYGLVRLGCDAEAPTGTTGVVQNKVRMLGNNDLLIAISFGRGLRETVEAAQRACRQDVPTFGITDGRKTPIARICDQHIVASTERTSFLDSYVAPVAAINAILVACAHSQPKRALELLAQTDKEDSEGARWYRENNAAVGKTRGIAIK